VELPTTAYGDPQVFVLKYQIYEWNVNEQQSEIVYVISIASVSNRTIRCQPVFQTEWLARQYIEENEIGGGEVEMVTLYK